MLTRVLAVLGAFYALGWALMLLQRHHSATVSRTTWSKYVSYGAFLLTGLLLVALDAFCCPLLNVIPADVGHIVYLGASGQGQADISRKRVREISL